MRWLIVLLSIAWLPLAVAMDALPVQPFEALYRVYYHGNDLGRGVIALRDRGDGRYEMVSELKPRGIAALMVEGIEESVSGEIRDGGLRPVHYRREDKDGVTEIRFDWQGNQAESLHEGERRTLQLEPGLVDRLSVYLQAMADFKNDRRVGSYTLTDKNRIRTYRIDIHGQASVDTPMGTFQTVHVSRHRQGSDNVIEFWFAPELDFLPVQILHRDEDGEKARLVLDRLQRG